MVWLLLVALALLVIAVLAYPLVKMSKRAPPARVDFDVAVYRDQLKELKEEINSGILTEDQAVAARIEIERRILAAEDAELKKKVIGIPRRNSRRASLVAVGMIALILPAGTALMYSELGSPQLAGESFDWRVRHDADLATASSTNALEHQLRDAPTPAGYKRLANMYFAAGQYDKAVAADHRAIDLGADDAVTWSEFGEAIVMAGAGGVSPQALVAFTNAISRDPHDARARFYIGLAEAQIGNLRQAVGIWRDLEEDGDSKSKWLPMVRQHIVAFSKQGGFDPGSIPPATPSADAMRSAVAAMTGALQPSATAGAATAPPVDMSASAANTQDAMIHAMVERLATRMATTPNDVAGWVRLAHAYNVLGEPEKARDAIGHAVRLKPNDIDVQLTLAETDKAIRLAKKR